MKVWSPPALRGTTQNAREAAPEAVVAFARLSHAAVAMRCHLAEKVLQTRHTPTREVGGHSRLKKVPERELTLSAESLEAIVDAVRDRLSPELSPVSPWLTRAQAAEYLGVPVSRLEKDRRVPSHRWEGRVMYHRGELDEYLLGFADAVNATPLPLGR